MQANPALPVVTRPKYMWLLMLRLLVLTAATLQGSFQSVQAPLAFTEAAARAGSSVLHCLLCLCRACWAMQ
jgi:hypothetical protein